MCEAQESNIFFILSLSRALVKYTYTSRPEGRSSKNCSLSHSLALEHSENISSASVGAPENKDCEKDQFLQNQELTWKKISCWIVYWDAVMLIFLHEQIFFVEEENNPRLSKIWVFYELMKQTDAVLQSVYVLIFH